VASKLTTVSAQDMIKAMTAGQRDPEVPAARARTGMKARHDELAEALDGMVDDHQASSPPCCRTRSPSWTARSAS